MSRLPEGGSEPVRPLDGTDARLLAMLDRDPRATVVQLAQLLGLSRNTVQARLARMERDGALLPHDVRVDPAALGYPVLAVVAVVVRQQALDAVSRALSAIPEVLEVLGLTGSTDLLVRVVATDADDLYRLAGEVLALEGVERTTTSLAMRRLVPHRVAPLVARRAGAPRDGG